MIKGLVAVFLAAVLTENYVLAKFLGICPFLGVSKKLNTAVGMSGAVTFVMVLATAVTYPIYMFLLVPAGLDYLQTIVFILVIAGLVADGVTAIDDIKYIERGYEDFDGKMRSLGADMAKVTCEKELKQFEFRAI